MDLAPLLTDGMTSAALLQRTLPGLREGCWDIESCLVTRTRRRIPRRPEHSGASWLGVCYRLRARETRSGRSDEQWLYAKAYRRGMSEGPYLDAMAEHCAMPRFGVPVAHVPELDLVVWSLPNDPAMAQLPAFLDAAAVRPHLPLARLYGPVAEEVQLAMPRVAGHEPEEHCTARFALHHRGRVDAIYGKTFAGERWRDARDSLAALWRRACGDPTAFLVGRPLGSSPALQAVWQEEVTGRPLATMLAGPDSETVLRALADALAHLHSDGPFAGRAESIGEPLERARKWHKDLVLADARLGPALELVLFALEGGAAAPGRLVTVHGDLHEGQMLWRDGRIALFAYDDLAVGSPARDLADLVSHLLCRDDRAADWRAVAARLVDLYRSRCAGEPSDDELDWHLRLMLLRRAHHAFVRQEAGWHTHATRALALARRGLAALHPPRGHAAAEVAHHA